MGAKVGRSQRLARHPKPTAIGWMSISFVFAELIARREDLLAQLAFMGYTLVIPQRWSLSTNRCHITVRLLQDLVYPVAGLNSNLDSLDMAEYGIILPFPILQDSMA